MERKKPLTILSSSGIAAILSSTASKSPTLPLFAAYLGANSALVGLIAAASTITGIIVNVTAGSLSDVYGRRKLLLASGFFFATSPFLYLLVTQPWELVAVRVYHGVATAIFTSVATAAIADLYVQRRGEMMGYFSSATLVGRLIAPVMAGTLITLYSFFWTYLVCGVFGLIAFALLTKFPETLRKPKHKGKNIYVGKVLRNINLILASSIMALTYFTMQSIETFIPLYLGSIGVEAWLTGVTLSVELGIIALLKPYGGRSYDRVGAGKIIPLGGIMLVLGISTIGLIGNYLAVLASLIVFAVGVTLITASVPPLISNLIMKEAYGTALGTMETIKDIGQALGPIVTGATLTSLPYSQAFLIAGVIATPILLLSALIKERIY